MPNQNSNKEIEEFMSSPLVAWFSNCLDIKRKLTLDDLVDGVLMHELLLRMYIDSEVDEVAPPNGDHQQRLKNLQVIMMYVRSCYEEDCVVLQEPNLRLIARAAHSNISEVRLLLELLLDCALRCLNKQFFVEKISWLDQVTQKVIASHIGKAFEGPRLDASIAKPIL